jgi:hypothetical protein
MIRVLPGPHSVSATVALVIIHRARFEVYSNI